MALLLLWPAVYNGFPLIFPDTGAYLAIAWGSFWTFDRSGFYGLLLKAFSGLPALSGLWTALVIQVFAIASVLLLTVRAFLPRFDPVVACAVVLLAALTTSLSWHSAQLMPDAFTGPCVLLTWLAVSRDPGESGAPLLWLCVLVSGLTHYTHIGLVPAAAAGALIAQALHRTSRQAIVKRAIAAAAATTAIVGAQFAANGLLLHRWSVSPAGPVFLFARLNEDQIIQPWLQRHCSRTNPSELCKIEPTLPRDSQKLLWDRNSPIDELVWRDFEAPSSQRLVGEMRVASIGSILEQPFSFAKIAARGTADQLVHFAVVDDECPRVCASPSSAIYDRFRVDHPEILPSFLASKQVRGTLPKKLVGGMIMPIEILSIVLLLPFAIVAARRRDNAALSLLLAIFAALIANAALAGVLSDVHDRYQSRIVWLVPFAEMLLAISWIQARTQPHRASAARSTDRGQSE